MRISLQRVAMDEEINESTAAYTNSGLHRQAMLRVKATSLLESTPALREPQDTVSPLMASSKS